ncbi:uncharacterized protein LOC120884238 isoform X2 [Ictidomys tridecemlineatus]
MLDPIHWTPQRRNFWKRLRCCFRSCCQCLAGGTLPIATPTSGRSSFRSTPDSPGEVHPGETITFTLNKGWSCSFSSNSMCREEYPEPSTTGQELGLREYSLGDLEDTLEPAFFYDSFSLASTISSSSIQQEVYQMLGSQVTLTGPEVEDQGHQVPALTENLEPMEEQAEAALVLVEASVRGPPPPPSDRELELDEPAVDYQGQHPLLALQSALHLERNPHPLFFSQIIWLFVFIVCIYYFSII